MKEEGRKNADGDDAEMKDVGKDVEKKEQKEGDEEMDEDEGAGEENGEDEMEEGEEEIEELGEGKDDHEKALKRAQSVNALKKQMSI